MIKQLFNKWITVFEKAEAKNKEMLKNKEINKDAYILLNTINHNKYNQIIKQYHKELV